MASARGGSLTTAMTGLVVGLTVIKAGNVVASKMVVNDVDAFSAVFYRSILAGTFVVLLGAMFRRAPVLPWRLGRLGLLTSAMFAANVTLFYFGMALTDAGRVAVIVNLQPLVVALVAPKLFPDESITVRKLVGLLIALGGVGCMVGLGESGGLRTGDGLVFGAMLLWAVGTVLEKRVMARLPPEQGPISIVVWNLACLAGSLTLWMVVTGRRPAPALGLEATYAMAYMVTFGSAMFLALRWVVQRAPVSLVTSFNFLLPVWGVLFSAVLLGEPLTSELLLGMALVALGIAVVNRPGRAPAPLPAPIPAPAPAD